MMYFSRALAASLSISLAVTPAAAQPAASLTRIGAAAAVRGPVLAVAPGTTVGRVVSSGKPIFLNDHVTTGDQGGLQVLLLDETVFTLGPKSDMVLDEFVYDPATEAGKVTARVTKGVFRFVTGKVAKKTPSNMQVKLPVGTMGIRGTMVAGRVDEDGSSTVILLGPGAGNNAQERPGAISVENEGRHVAINRPGFGTTLREGQPPAPPSDMSHAAKQIAATLEAKREEKKKEEKSDEKGAEDPKGKPEEKRGKPEDKQEKSEEQKGKGENRQGKAEDKQGPREDSSEEKGKDQRASKDDRNDRGQERGGPSFDQKGSASDQAGQSTAAGGTSLDSSLDTSKLGDSLNSDSTQASQDATKGRFADGISKWDEVRSVTIGKGIYHGNGTYNCTSGCSGKGSINFKLEIDFAARKVGGTGSFLQLSGTTPQINDSTTLREQSFTSLSGRASFKPNVDNSAFSDTSISLNNRGGIPAKEAAVDLRYNTESKSATGGVVGTR